MSTKPSKSKTRIPLQKWTIALASLFCLLLLNVYWILPQQSHQQKLFAAFYEPYKMVLPLDVPKDHNLFRLEALKAYQAEMYQSMLGVMQEMPYSEMTNVMTFYKGQALLAIGEVKPAIRLFTELENSTRPFTFRQANEWYLALSYLQIKEHGSCRDMLDCILSIPNHQYRAKAKALLNELGYNQV